jgi:hypothetical protein
MTKTPQPSSGAGSTKPVKFRAYFTTKNGKKIYAKDYGHPCWPIGKSGKK